MSTDVMPGGWTSFSAPVSPEAMEVFNQAIGGLIGVQYTPMAVATQAVAGINYRFFCNAKVVYPNAPNTAAMVSIFKPLQGNAHVTSISQI